MLMGLCVLHITNTCNLRCKHCYASAGQPLPDTLTFEEIIDIIDQLAELNINYITLSGGEPFLHERLFDIIDYINTKNIHIMITTNGTTLTDEVVEKIKAAGVDSLQVSIDSSIPEIHDEFRGAQGAFAKAVEGIKLCKKHGVKVSIMSTLSAVNKDDVDGLINLGLKLGVNAFAMERFVPEGRGHLKPEISISSKDLKNFFDKLNQGNREHPECLFTTNDPLFQFSNGQYEVMYNLRKQNPQLCGGCSLGQMAFIITPDAKIALCTRFYEKIGSIRDKKIKDILNENKLIHTVCDRTKLKGRCGRCKYKFICGGCRGWAYNTTGDYHAEDSLCWLTEEEIHE